MNNTFNNYSLVSENELGEILSHYNSEFVISVVDNTINTCCDNYNGMPMANVVKMWEQNFKSILEEYDDEMLEVRRVREETYKEIIDRICVAYNLNFTIDDGVDLYAAAFHLYDFFVSNLGNNIVNFFSYYIINNKDELYNSMGLEYNKKKDSTQALSKNIQVDEKIAALANNIMAIVDNIIGMDIQFDDVVDTLYMGQMKPVGDFLLSIVSPADDLFFNRFCKHLKDNSRITLMTMIRFAISKQAIQGNDINNLQNIIVDDQ